MTRGTVAISVETLRKFSELTNLLSQVGEVARDITRDVTDPQKTTPPATFLLNAQDVSKDLWKMHDEMQQAFADMSSDEIDALVDEAVAWARRKPKT